MSINAKQVEQALREQDLRKHVQAIDDNDGEVVIWAGGTGHPVSTIEAAVSIAHQSNLEKQCRMWGI